MTKKLKYYDEAERLYVNESLGLDSIAAKLNLSKRTISYWKAQNDWDVKKKSYLHSKQAFHQELYDFSRELMYSIRQDMRNGEKVDQGRLFTFGRMIPLIAKIKSYEEGIRGNEQQENGELTKEIIDKIETEILGIKSQELQD